MGKTLTVSVPHKVSRDEAKQRIQKAVAENKGRFAKMAQVDDRWTGDRMDFTASAMGQTVTGRVDVNDDAVVVHVDLPWMLAMMSSRIKGEIEGEGRKLLESQ